MTKKTIRGFGGGPPTPPTPYRAPDTLNSRQFATLLDLLSESEINELVQKTSDGGAEIVGLLKTGSAYFAPASAAATMVKSILSDSNQEIPVCAWLDGEYGISDVYLGVTAKLGSEGVTEIIEHELTNDEKKALFTASEA